MKRTITLTALLLSLALVVPAGAQSADLGPVNHAAVLDSLHDLPSGHLLLFEGEIRNVVSIETTAESFGFTTHHRATYLDMELTTGHKVRLQCDRSACQDLEREDHVFAVARLSAIQSGLQGVTTRFSLVSFVRK